MHVKAREGHRERERKGGTCVCVSKLVFYAQSTGAVISGRCVCVCMHVHILP